MATMARSVSLPSPVKISKKDGGASQMWRPVTKRKGRNVGYVAERELYTF